MQMNRLRQLLKAHNVTQTELARLLGRDKAVITNLLQGRRRLQAVEAMKIARHLNVPVAEVLGEQKPAHGMEERVLIPFQQAPETSARKHAQVVRAKGKYYLESFQPFGPQAFALEVKDDSLNLAGILPGDITVCDMGRECKAGETVVVQHYQRVGAKTLLRKYQPPLLLPHSTNSAHAPLREDDRNVRMVCPVVCVIRLMG